MTEKELNLLKILYQMIKKQQDKIDQLEQELYIFESFIKDKLEND